MKEQNLYIICGIKSDLKKIKFDKVQIIEFENFPFTKDERYYNVKKDLDNEFLFDYSKRFIIYSEEENPINITTKAFNFLRIIFPSSLIIEYFIDYKKIGDEFKIIDIYKTASINNDFDLLEFENKNIKKINIFIKDYFPKFYKIKYVENAIKNYIGAFDAQHKHFKFLSLCICLECLITETTELLYRISRGASIIIGTNPDTSFIIFNNIKEIYKLRSKIVHGSNFDESKLENYINYLQCLVSKIVVELLIHNVEDSKCLNSQFTKLGFGDRKKISDNWFSFNYNSKIENEISKKI